MKKLTLILALISLMAVCFGSFSVNAAGPLDNFREVDPPAEEDKIISTTWNYFVGVNQLTDPVGSWTWNNTFDGKPGCWGSNYHDYYLDSDLKTIILQFKDEDLAGKDKITGFVFADNHTASGAGSVGRIRAKAETFEKMTVVYSDDGENWTEVGFSVAYHSETGIFGDSIPVDTYWHLIFDEAIPAVHYVTIHTSEPKAWDAEDHVPTLGICLGHVFTYCVMTDYPAYVPPTEAPTTAAPTEAPTTEAPTTEAPTEAPATNAPVTTEPVAENGGLDAWVYAVIAVAAVAVIVTIVIVVKKKK